MEKHLYVFRHGQTDYNKENRVQGQSNDLPLNETGRQQAKALAERLKDINLEVIFSSPLKRAIETAEAISELKNIPIIIEPDLIETNLGEIEGLTIAEIDPKQMETWHGWSDIDFCFPGGESKRSTKERIVNVMKKLVDTPYNTIAVSTHGALTSCLLNHCGYERTFSLPQGLPFHFVYQNGEFKLIKEFEF